MGFLHSQASKIDLPKSFSIPVGDGKKVEATKHDGSTRYEIYEDGVMVAKLTPAKANRANELAQAEDFSKVRAIVYSPFNF